jgi:hypothetical protein
MKKPNSSAARTPLFRSKLERLVDQGDIDIALVQSDDFVDRTHSSFPLSII